MKLVFLEYVKRERGRERMGKRKRKRNKGGRKRDEEEDIRKKKKNWEEEIGEESIGKSK